MGGVLDAERFSFQPPPAVVNLMSCSSSSRTSKVPSLLLLPNELLEIIFSSLSRQDLTQVVLVCWPLALSGRLLLYQSVDIRSDDPYIDLTLNLLRDKTLGARILDATLTTRRPARGCPRHWIDPDLFFHWTKLQSLELRGFPFSDVRDIEVFERTIQQSCFNLQSFTYRPVFGSLPREGFRLRGLKSVSLQTTIEMPITHFMAASVDSITHISFVGTVTHLRGKPYDDFLNLRLPFLKSLELGSLEHSHSEPMTNIAITNFILAHPGIEHLSFGKTRPKYHFFQFDPDRLKPGSLPSLKSFEGFPENITALARCPVRSFFSITSLAINCTNNDANSHQLLSDMFTAVSGEAGMARTLSLVTDLRFEFPEVLNHRMASNATSRTYRMWMDELSVMCPGVVRWDGKLPAMDAAYFMNMFSMYERLEVISLPRLSIAIHMSSKVDYFREIARKCRKLRKVVARRPQYTELEDHVFTLWRDEHGDLAAVGMRATRDEVDL